MSFVNLDRTAAEAAQAALGHNATQAQIVDTLLILNRHGLYAMTLYLGQSKNLGVLGALLSKWVTIAPGEASTAPRETTLESYLSYFREPWTDNLSNLLLAREWFEQSLTYLRYLLKGKL